MKRAVVIKTYGDRETALAILDGMARADRETAAVRAECDRLRNMIGLRAYGDRRRFARARRELDERYTAEPMHPVAGALLDVWALVWCALYAAYDALEARDWSGDE